MKILPLQTRPPSTKVDRCHVPRPTAGRFGYQGYRACLRWEFGFTCAFCLLHESDFVEYGAEGLGLLGVEHFVPVSAEGDANSYENCFYACRLCNGSRSDAPVVDLLGRRLLEPCGHTWADHFQAAPDDRLRPMDGDPDAAYTHATYDLDDPRKMEIRCARRRRIEVRLLILSEGLDLLEPLLDRLRREPPEQRADLLRVAEQLRRGMDQAVTELLRYAAVPRDADAGCRCGRNDHHRLPAGLADQLLDISPL
jgi:hypothetical protein